MKKRIAAGAAVLAAVIASYPLRAHHSISMIDIGTPVWVQGIVVEYEVVNPHVMIALEERNKDGQVQRWTIEGPGLGRLNRYGLGQDFLRAGDAIAVCGFVPKPHAETAYPPPLFIHGHLLVTPNGQMQLWGPYGKLDNCVRPDDQRRSWLSFLDATPMARQIWCNRYTASFPLSALSSRRLVGEINGLLANLCE